MKQVYSSFATYVSIKEHGIIIKRRKLKWISEDILLARD